MLIWIQASRKTKTFEKAVHKKLQGKVQDHRSGQAQGTLWDLQGIEQAGQLQHRTFTIQLTHKSPDHSFDGKFGQLSLKIYYLFSGTHFRSTIYSPTQIFIKEAANAPPKAFVYKDVYQYR